MTNNELKYLDLQKQVFLTMSKMSRLQGKIDQANQEEEIGLNAAEFPVFELEIKWSVYFPMEFEPKHIDIEIKQVPI
jgi:hypothetical protein